MHVFQSWFFKPAPQAAGIFVLLLAIATPAFSEKTDIVMLTNGDKITGEVKSLQYGKLNFKTDDMGTLSIKWDKIAYVEAKEYFEIELQDGTLYYGSLEKTSSRFRMTVVNDKGKIELYRFFVVRLTPLESLFWARVDGKVALGFDYTKATTVAKLNFTGDATYKAPKYLAKIDFNSNITSQEDKETTRRQNISAEYVRTMKSLWHLSGGTTLEQNTELGLDARLSLTLGGGRTVFQSNENGLLAFSGVSLNKEWSKGAGSGPVNVEVPFGLVFTKFRYDTPKIDLRTTLTNYLGITTFGRFRMNYDFEISWEFIKDFTLNTTVYFNYDSEPVGEAISKIDWSIIFSFGWKF